MTVTILSSLAVLVAYLFWKISVIEERHEAFDCRVIDQIATLEREQGLMSIHLESNLRRLELIKLNTE